MGSFIAGLTIGLIVGVSGTFVLIIGRVAISGEGFSATSRPPYRSFIFIMAGLVSLAWSGHILKIGKASSILLLLLAVLAIARYGGLVYGLSASAIAAISLTLLSFPPIGSLMIAKPHDRFALTLFLLVATLGSRFFGRVGSERSITQAN